MSKRSHRNESCLEPFGVGGRPCPPECDSTRVAGTEARRSTLEISMTNFLQQLINGIVLGSKYALIALGYTMVYGVLRLINFAHGDVYMFGAFMGYYLARIGASQTDGSLLRAIVIMIGAMILSAGLGMLIERFAYRPGRSGSKFTMAFWLGILGAVIGHFLSTSIPGLVAGAIAGIVIGVVVERFAIRSVRRASRLAFLILAIGVSFLLENGGQLVFGADPKFFPQIIQRRTNECRRPKHQQSANRSTSLLPSSSCSCSTRSCTTLRPEGQCARFPSTWMRRD